MPRLFSAINLCLFVGLTFVSFPGPVVLGQQPGEQAKPSGEPIEHLPLALAMTQPTFLTPERRQQNLLVGGNFEDDAASKWKLNSFRGNKLSGAIEGSLV